MKSTPITQHQMAMVRSSVEDVARIKDNARLIAGKLERTFSDHHPRVNWGVHYNLGADKIEATIETPYCLARARLVLGVDEHGPMGRYLFERRVQQQDDSTAWIPAWSIRIGRYGEISTEGNTSNPIDLDHPFKGQDHVDELALSLLYAIAKSL